MGKVVCFGEIMGRLNPTGYQKIVQANSFELSFAGGEVNVAVSLANFGLAASFVTKLPSNDLSRHAIRVLKGYDVDVSRIAYGGDRMGMYFVEKGASQRPSKVIYDRKSSSLATARREDFPWPEIFEDADWFHVTGITPALSDELAEICLEAFREAKKRGVYISCDLNYRKSLWSGEKAGKVMGGLMGYVDLCIANEEDAERVFGIKAQGSDVTAGTLSREGYVAVARAIAERFHCGSVAFTLRGSLSASDNRWAGMLVVGGKSYFSREYLIHLVDRVGGGDSFGGGLIYALESGYEPQKTIDFAGAASCLKHTIEYDFNQVTVAEVEALLEGDCSGRVQR
jgi:2-dehydro-3-deoxygluconokinase